MDVEITLVGRPPVCSSVPGGEHLRNVPGEADSSLSMAAHNYPIGSRVVGRERREGEEGDERQRFVVRGDVEAVLLLREIAVLSGMIRTAGGWDTCHTQAQT